MRRFSRFTERFGSAAGTRALLRVHPRPPRVGSSGRPLDSLRPNESRQARVSSEGPCRQVAHLARLDRGLFANGVMPTMRGRLPLLGPPFSAVRNP
jgi:hypothetical protein